MFSYQGSLFVSFFSSDSFYILSKAFVFVKNFFIFLSLFSSFPLPSHATAYLGYHFQNSLSTTFLIYFSIISLIFKSSSFLPIKNVPPPRLLYLPFLCCFPCCSSATNVILSQLFLIVNVFYIFHAIQNILKISICVSKH